MECPTRWLADVMLVAVAVLEPIKSDGISIFQRRAMVVQTQCQTLGGSANVINRFPIRQLLQTGQRSLGRRTHDSQRGNGSRAVIGTGVVEVFQTRLQEPWRRDAMPCDDGQCGKLARIRGIGQVLDKQTPQNWRGG